MDYCKVEELMSCPYNSSHQILPHRMAMHLIKCRKNYPRTNMKVCIFNAVHVVPAAEYRQHLLDCKDRNFVERDFITQPLDMKGGSSMKSELNSSIDYDDWEEDSVQSSYSPEKHIICKEFTRPPPPGLSKSARKQWRLDEIERVKHVKTGMLLNDPQRDTNTHTSVKSTVSVKADWASGGAFPKYKDISVKGTSSHAELGQVCQKERQMCREASPTNPDQPANSCTLGNHVNNSQDSETVNKRLQLISIIKQKRKLEKKLFEIKKLEKMKLNSDEKLTDQEEAKILLKKDITKQLSDLMDSITL